jgi:hypothetical protein
MRAAVDPGLQSFLGDNGYQSLALGINILALHQQSGNNLQTDILGSSTNVTVNNWFSSSAN